MSVPFPYTINGRGAGVGRIVAQRDASVKYSSIPQNHGNTWWHVDERLMQNGNTALAITSALSLVRPGLDAVLTLVEFPSQRICGASCGAAATLALLGVCTDVIVTGFFRAIGQGDFRLCEVDSMDEKILLTQRLGRPFVVPIDKACHTLMRLMEEEKVVTYYTMLSHPFDREAIGAASSLSDLVLVVKYFDPSVPLDVLLPVCMRRSNPT